MRCQADHNGGGRFQPVPPTLDALPGDSPSSRCCCNVCGRYFQSNSNTATKNLFPIGNFPIFNGNIDVVDTEGSLSHSKGQHDTRLMPGQTPPESHALPFLALSGRPPPSGNRIQQALRIRMLWRSEHLCRLALLDDPPVLHHQIGRAHV